MLWAGGYSPVNRTIPPTGTQGAIDESGEIPARQPLPRTLRPPPPPPEPMERLSAHLGGPKLWIKRDDCTGLASGGNKTRKLEWLMGEAGRQGAHHIGT